MRVSKLFLMGIIVVFVLLASCFFWYAKEQVKEEEIDRFYTNSVKKLKVVDDYISMFFDLYKGYVSDLSLLPELLIAEKDFPHYREKEGEHTWSYETLSAPGKKVVQVWRDFVLKDDDIVDIYAGFESGTSISYEAYEFPVGFLGAERPWYKQAKESAQEVNIGHAYLSLSGETVTPVTSKIYNQEGKFTGVIGLDISLESITTYLEALNFYKTGHFVLLEKGGLILCNSKHRDYNFRYIHELPDLAWEEIFMSNHDSYLLEFNDQKNYLVSSYIGKSGYRLLAIMSEEEVISSSSSVYTYIILIGVLVVLVSFILYFTQNNIKPRKKQ